jgi:hypothetical protein
LALNSVSSAMLARRCLSVWMPSLSRVIWVARVGDLARRACLGEAPFEVFLE